MGVDLLPNQPSCPSRLCDSHLYHLSEIEILARHFWANWMGIERVERRTRTGNNGEHMTATWHLTADEHHSPVVERLCFMHEFYTGSSVCLSVAI